MTYETLWLITQIVFIVVVLLAIASVLGFIIFVRRERKKYYDDFMAKREEPPTYMLRQRSDGVTIWSDGKPIGSGKVEE